MRGDAPAPACSLPPRAQPPHHRHKSGVFITTDRLTGMHHAPKSWPRALRLTSAAVRSVGWTITRWHAPTTAASHRAVSRPCTLQATHPFSLLIQGQHHPLSLSHSSAFAGTVYSWSSNRTTPQTGSRFFTAWELRYGLLYFCSHLEHLGAPSFGNYE